MLQESCRKYTFKHLKKTNWKSRKNGNTITGLKKAARERGTEEKETL